MKLSRLGSLEAIVFSLGLLTFGKAEDCDLDVWQYQFNGSCYYFLERGNTWYEAKNICDNMGGALASIHTNEENDFIQEKAGNINTWLGLVGVSLHPITFKWEDKTMIDFQNWEVAEPDGIALDTMCTRMGANGRWKDTDCESKQWAVCKQSLAVVATTEPTPSTEPVTEPSSEHSTENSTEKTTSTSFLQSTSTTDHFKSDDGCHTFTWDKCNNDFGETIVNDLVQESAIDCQNLCTGIYSPGCKTFVFNNHHKTCTLYKKVISNVADKCDTYGGPKEPTIDSCKKSRCTEFWLTGCEYEGFNLTTYPSIPDTNTCQKVCKEFTEGCNFWVYIFKDNVCHTYSNPIMDCELWIGPSDHELEQCYTTE